MPALLTSAKNGENSTHDHVFVNLGAEGLDHEGDSAGEAVVVLEVEQLRVDEVQRGRRDGRQDRDIRRVARVACKASQTHIIERGVLT